MENKYFVTSKELQAYLKTLKRFDLQGNNGVTYHNGKVVVKYVYKEYHGDISKLLQFRDIKIRDFYFVKSGIYLYLRPTIRCTISRYAVGEMLYLNNISCVDINKLIKACARIEIAVQELSHASIRVGDVISANILFDKDCFKFIDTTEYSFSSKRVELIYRQNMRDIMKVVFSKIIGNYIMEDFRTLLRNDGYLHPSIALSNYQDELRRRGYEFNTFEEVNMILRRKRLYK